MKFTLKDYQEEAVEKILINLRKARKRWHEEGDKHAFSLAATTGAGKTVMAAAAFEALFHGDENYDFEGDSSAVVIWFSDDPSLNEQIPEGAYVTALETSNIARKGDGQWLSKVMFLKALRRAGVSL